MLALFALYLRVLIPLGQAIPLGHDENGFPTRLVVCALYGPQVLDVKPGEEAPDGQINRERCPVCAAFSIGATLLDGDAAASIDVPQFSIASPFAPAEVNIASQFLPGSRTARAPPAFA